MSSTEISSKRTRLPNGGGSSFQESSSENVQPQLCSFCQDATAAVMVSLPSLRSKKGKPIRTPFCLLHYYTTSACRVGGIVDDNNPGDANVTVIDSETLENQLGPQQDLFAEAYVQLQQELQEATMQHYATHKNDPLAILSDLNKSSKRRRTLKVPPAPRESPEGGFLRDIPLPERFVRIQQQQLQKERELIARMNRVADTTQRRKPTRRSIWNVLGDDDRKPPPPGDAKKATQSYLTVGDLDNDRSCSCGSDRVETVFANSSNRNQDMAKAETWGNKDRGGDVVTRYRCTECGKTWNEEE